MIEFSESPFVNCKGCDVSYNKTPIDTDYCVSCEMKKGRKGRPLKDFMNEPAHCNGHCPKEWGCGVCGCSKGHPPGWLEERDMDRKGQQGSTITAEELTVTDKTIERIRRGK